MDIRSDTRVFASHPLVLYDLSIVCDTIELWYNGSRLLGPPGNTE